MKSLPSVLQGGVRRFTRSLGTGLCIAIDYKFSLWGLDDSSDDYQDSISQAHSRSASRILTTCLENGGLYIKFGQGMCTHGVLPQEYSKVLVVLQDQALRRERDDEALRQMRERMNMESEVSHRQSRRSEGVEYDDRRNLRAHRRSSSNRCKRTHMSQEERAQETKRNKEKRAQMSQEEKAQILKYSKGKRKARAELLMEF